MAWGGFFDERSSDYLRLLAKIERTIQNLEELLKLTPAAQQAILQQAIEVLAELPSKLREGRE
ncbi:MAG TPA: hypothetical protein VKK79_13385 [Candidatus Lokiarchaeia archaeon]|nr:hypothetical protein [Candidatus Lokiarchaeia archaeon]